MFMRGRDLPAAGFLVGRAKPVVLVCVWVALTGVVLTAGCSKTATLGPYDLWGRSTTAAPTPEYCPGRGDSVDDFSYASGLVCCEGVAKSTSKTETWGGRAGSVSGIFHEGTRQW